MLLSSANIVKCSFLYGYIGNPDKLEQVYNHLQTFPIAWHVVDEERVEFGYYNKFENGIITTCDGETARHLGAIIRSVIEMYKAE